MKEYRKIHQHLSDFDDKNKLNPLTDQGLMFNELANSKMILIKKVKILLLLYISYSYVKY